MSKTPRLVVMLTQNDTTVENAPEIFEACKDTEAEFFGIKETGLCRDKMKALFRRMKECGKTTFLEVVAYTEKECLEGAHTAKECGCDILMGTLFYDSVNEYCKNNSLRYMPFIGDVSQRPSVLEGSAEKMIAEARTYLSKGVYGFDLLAYRYTGDADRLIDAFVSALTCPVCIAGSIDSYEKLRLVKKSEPEYFTIGGAFFDGIFGKTFDEQIRNVLEYIKK